MPEETNFFQQALTEISQGHPGKNLGTVPQRKPFKLLPGDPIKGTIYKGFISEVTNESVKNPNSLDYNEPMLIVKLQVIGGEYKGNEEIINRVINPKRYQNEPSSEAAWEYWIKEAQKNNPQLDMGDDQRTQAKKAWLDAGRNYYKKTLEQLVAMGVDISSGDEKKIVEEVANSVGNPVAWKVYDKTSSKDRRVYLESPSAHFPKKDREVVAPNLFQSLPDGSDIPID